MRGFSHASRTSPGIIIPRFAEPDDIIGYCDLTYGAVYGTVVLHQRKGTIMQGLWIKGERPRTKKAVKEAIAGSPASVVVESTSFFPNGDFMGSLGLAPVGTRVHFVGPDPERARNFYGTITVTDTGIKVS